MANKASDNMNDTPQDPQGIHIAQAWHVEQVALDNLPGEYLYIFNLPDMPSVTVAAPGYGEFAAFLQAVVRDLMPPGRHITAKGFVTHLPGSATGASGKGSTHD